MVKILYHANCWDGFFAAFAAYLVFKDKAVYIPVNYGENPPDVNKNDEVYILDFSYNRETLIKMQEECKCLTVIDHHKTAKEALEKLPNCHFDMFRSGAVLAWQYFHKTSVPEIYKYIEDRDLWIFKYPNSKEFSSAMKMYDFDFKFWEKQDIHNISGFIEEGVTCEKMVNKQVDIMSKNHFWIEFLPDQKRFVFLKEKCNGEFCAPVANATIFFSEVGNRLLEMYPECQFSAYYFDRKDGKRQFGLRSRKEYDCSIIAKMMGGGGHKNASGFEINI